MLSRGWKMRGKRMERKYIKILSKGQNSSFISHWTDFVFLELPVLNKHSLRQQDERPQAMESRQRWGIRSEKGKKAGHFHRCDKFVCNIKYLTLASYFKPHVIYLFNRRVDYSANSPFVLSKPYGVLCFLSYIVKSYTKSACSS